MKKVEKFFFREYNVLIGKKYQDKMKTKKKRGRIYENERSCFLQ